MKIVFLVSLLVTASLAGEPKWIMDPSMGGKFTGAIGCAKEKKALKLQEKIALLRAKGAISQQIETTMQERTHRESSFDGDDFETDFGFETIEESTTSFKIKKMDTYLYKDKSLCIWVIKK